MWNISFKQQTIGPGFTLDFQLLKKVGLSVQYRFFFFPAAGLFTKEGSLVLLNKLGSNRIKERRLKVAFGIFNRYIVAIYKLI